MDDAPPFWKDHTEDSDVDEEVGGNDGMSISISRGNTACRENNSLINLLKTASITRRCLSLIQLMLVFC
jgi:hypothetical protein